MANKATKQDFLQRLSWTYNNLQFAVQERKVLQLKNTEQNSQSHRIVKPIAVACESRAGTHFCTVFIMETTHTALPSLLQAFCLLSA